MRGWRCWFPGDDSALFVQIDSCLIGDSDVDAIKGRIESRIGIGRANVPFLPPIPIRPRR